MLVPIIDDSIFALLEKFLRTYKASNHKKISKAGEHSSFIVHLAEKFSKKSTCPIKSHEELVCAIETFLCPESARHSENSSNSSEISAAQQFQRFGFCNGSSEALLTRIDKYEDNRRPQKFDPLKLTAVSGQSKRLKQDKQGLEG